MSKVMAVLVLALSLLGDASQAHAAEWRGSAVLDRLIEEAVARGEIPGAVLLVSHQGKIVHRKAYGMRSLVPEREPMTVDTIFDLASLTKVVATTPALMILFEEGKLRLDDRVTQYLPEFENGQSAITVRQLFTHFSGLRPDLDVKPPWAGYQTGIALALAEKPVNPPGTRFVYSDINFVLLGEIARRLSGEPLAEFTRRRIYEPIGMKDTMFHPPAAVLHRIAPTEQLEDGTILRGVVDDPTARFMGGAAGDAGLFSTADDLSRYAAMVLNHGGLDGKRIFSPLTLEKMTSPQTPPNQPVIRGLGWDIDSPYSSNRGELLPVGSFGHTGFTGTSLWIDPATQTFIVLLANSGHPKIKAGIVGLRARVATAVAAALDVPPDLSAKEGLRLTGYNEAMVGAKREIDRNGQVLTGLDVLVRDRFRQLQGRRIGLITNQTGIDRNRRRDVDLMIQAGVKVEAIFSPEHGFSGNADDPSLPDGVDEKSGVRIYSLFQPKRRRPSAAMLRGIDALVFDIQDIGTRFYTYVTTMGYAMEEAAKMRIPFFVLDRPNPVNGVTVEGPMLDPGHLSFVGYFPLPLRHGMTVGELARLFNTENKIGADLTVIRMEGWQRGDWFDSTGLPWVNPSPNMRNLSEALLYPGVAMLEGLPNYSVGRGTDTPFELLGADWIDGAMLAQYLNSRQIPGIRFYPVEAVPSSSRLAGRQIQGVHLLITDRNTVDSGQTGVEIASALLRLFPGRLDLQVTADLIGSDGTLRALAEGQDPVEIRQGWQDAIRRFLRLRERFLLY